MTVGTHRRSSRLDWNNVLGPVPSELLSCVSLTPPLFPFQRFIFSSTFLFFFFRPPFLFDGFYYLLFDLMHRREFLISVIRLTYSEGGIYLLVCLFAFSPKFDSRIDSAFRFDMVRQSTTGSFFITKMKQKIRKQKEMVLLDWHRSEPGYHGLSYRIWICCWRAMSWVWLGLISWWMVDIRFWSFLLCLLACLLSWLNLLALLLLSFALGIFTFICVIPYLHTLIPFNYFLVVFLFYTYISYILLVHTIWYDMIWYDHGLCIVNIRLQSSIHNYWIASPIISCVNGLETFHIILITALDKNCLSGNPF